MRLWPTDQGRAHTVSMLAGYGRYYAYIPKNTSDLETCVRVSLPSRQEIKILSNSCILGRWFADKYDQPGNWIWQIRHPDECLAIMRDVLSGLPQRMRREVIQHITFIEDYQDGKRPPRKKKPRFARLDRRPGRD